MQNTPHEAKQMSHTNTSHSLDYLFLVIAALHGIGTIYTFAFEGHYVIPSILFFNGILFGHLAYFGLKGKALAKIIMFWLSVALSAHLFFALFFAITPPKLLGALFYPVYGTAFILMAAMSVQYLRRNQLFQYY